MEPQVKPKVFQYRVQVRWEREKIGLLQIPEKPPLEVASPPEFRGHPGYWSPEDLLVAAVNSCTMTTFLSLATRRELTLAAYECEAVGTLERVEGAFRFSRILLRPRIAVARPEDREKALALFHEAETGCLIANSLLSRVESEPEIELRK